MVVATLTVFEGQVVFQAERAGLIPAVFLFRLRRGSRQITPGENWP